MRRIFKRILKFAGITLLAATGVIFLLLALDQEKISSKLTQPPAHIQATKIFVPSEDSLRYESLMNEFGNNKELPHCFELQTLVALSHYPQLKDTPIEFRLTDSEGSLYSQMNVGGVLFPWKKRKYIVLIDTIKTEEYVKPTLLANLPYNAQIGVLGHELAHTMSYLDKNSLQLAWTAIRYQSSKKYAVKFENDTEKRTISFGLGYQLLSWSEFQYHIKIKEGKGPFYFEASRIKQEMEQYDFY